MKTRNGFVSNSSSCSFTIERKYVSDYQLEKIKRHIRYAKENIHGMYANDEDRWDVDIKGDTIMLETFMDNFDMRHFLAFIGVPPEALIKEYHS